MKIKVILSTFGPLHLIKSAEYLSILVDIKVIQAWIPKWYDKFLVKFASKIVGRDLSKSFEKRIPDVLKDKNYSCAFAEFSLWTLRSLSKHTNLINTTKISLYAAQIYGWQSLKYIKSADIFHVRSGSGFSGAIKKAKSKGMKVLVDHSIAHPAFMDMQLEKEFKKNHVIFDMGSKSPYWGEIINECHTADRILVNSNFVKDTFVAEGFNPALIDVVYLGVREDFWGLKQTWNTNGVIRILFTGSFGFRKGAEYLLKALQELDKLKIDYLMTVVGDNQEAKSLIHKYSVKNISFVGHIPQTELKDYLKNSDIYLFPSLCEGCASSGMEAMAVGLPVIATKESGLPITNNEDGIIIAAQNEHAIVDSILFLMNNEAMRSKLGRNAAIKISTNYSWENYAFNVNEVYKSLVCR